MSIYSTYQPEESNGLFLKLKDGDSFKIRIISEPAITVYKEGDRPRYAWVVYNHDQKKVQIYGAGVSVYSQISALIEDWGEPTDFDLRVKREGSGIQDTTYIVTPVKTSSPVPKEAQAEAKEIDLIAKTKGKWLADYVNDRILPKPITDTVYEEPPLTDDDAASYEPISLDDLPEGM